MPTDKRLAKFVVLAVGEYMRRCPDDPQVVRLRAQLDELRADAWRWN